MALTGSSIASTYLKLLRVNTDTMGADATASYIQDSADTDSALSISTTRVGIGTATPSVAFEIKSPSGNVYAQKIISSDDQSLFTFEQKATGGAARFDMYNAGAESTIKLDTDGDSYFNGGNVTMPSQPAFSVYPASTQDNIATGGVTVLWGTERFDQGADFATNVFTAPVAGRYCLQVSLNLRNLDTACNVK
jgi:hypothetical protein